MDSRFQDLFNRVYEIEGLILLLDKKSDDFSGDLLSLLKDKVSELNGLVSKLGVFDNSMTEEHIEELMLKSDVEVGIIEQQIKETENIITESVDTCIEEKIETLLVETELSSDDVVDFEFIEEVIDEKEEQEPDDESDEINNTEDAFDDNLNETITLDEKLARQGSRDLKHAFTLNDRYRFRRELFGNIDTDFTDTINLVSAMTSLQEAEEYFYGDLEWDKDNEEVQDFMTIISHYFSN